VGAAAADDEDNAVPLGSLALEEPGEEPAGVLDAAAVQVEPRGGTKGSAAQLAEQAAVEILPPAMESAPLVFKLELRRRGGGRRLASPNATAADTGFETGSAGAHDRRIVAVAFDQTVKSGVFAAPEPQLGGLGQQTWDEGGPSPPTGTARTVGSSLRRVSRFRVRRGSSFFFISRSFQSAPAMLGAPTGIFVAKNYRKITSEY
jgi:hypothetical protein